MNINWKLKSKIFRFIDLFHFHNILYFLQDRVTKRSKILLNEPEKEWLFHESSVSRLKQPVLIEIGAGRDLRQNIFLSFLCNRQIAVDLFPMLNIAKFNEAAQQISLFEERINFFKCSTINEIEKNYNIKYLAPFDMTKCSFLDDSFDLCISTNTFEHIPLEDLKRIFNQLLRIIKPSGLLSIHIDYSDHYSHTDNNIGPLNFLKFSAKQWEKFNHPSHFQNRLRHYDYKKLFLDLGFHIKYGEGLNIAE